MSVEEIIEELSFFADKLRNGIFGERVGAIYQAIDLLKTHQMAGPNEPLNPKDLKKVDGEPVWLECSWTRGWVLVNCRICRYPYLIFDSGERILAGCAVDDRGRIYRHPPNDRFE